MVENKIYGATSFAVILMKEIRGTILPGGRVSRRIQRVTVLSGPLKIRNQCKKELLRMVLNLTEYIQVISSFIDFSHYRQN